MLANKIGLSIIIPMYNSEGWIGPTLAHIRDSLVDTRFDAEILVIDDGSTDGGAAEAKSIDLGSLATVDVVERANQGRYLARKVGVELSTKENILFIDSRVFIDKGSLHFLETQLQDNPDQLWNGHVNIDKRGNIFTRFWDAIVCIAWRRYFRHPTTTQYGIKDFDYYPKGTGFFYVPKGRLVAAMEYFEQTTNDVKHSSDDTLLIRFMNERQDIHLSPSFSCLYHGRTNMKSFLKHAYHRGEFFIDGFMHPGTRFFVPLLLVLAISVAIIPMLLMWPLYAMAALVVFALLLAVGLCLGALLFGVGVADAFSLGLLGAPFAAVYLTGLWRGVIRKFAKK